eukprot:7483083-Pyramimonas_sp.AAC.1
MHRVGHHSVLVGHAAAPELSQLVCPRGEALESEISRDEGPGFPVNPAAGLLALLLLRHHRNLH